MKIKIIPHNGKFLIKKGATYYNDAYDTLEDAQAIADQINFHIQNAAIIRAKEKKNRN